jgi:trans-aconitate methyltransferase
MSGTADARGYVTDASYAETFFRELSPAWLNYVAALNGALARPLDAPFRYLELGCGLGGSTVVTAGAFPHAEVHGCDVNPAHVAAARRHAAALDLQNVQFHETTFEALAERELPPFDFIVLHGVYSWVDATARRVVRRLVGERLAPGGFVYVSYNCMPGWAAEIPLRRLLVELAATAPGTAEARAAAARDRLSHLAAVKPRYLATHPAAGQAIAAYAREPLEYLAHEFLNDAWEPFYSIDVADDLAGAGLTYVGSATLPDNHPALVLDAAAVQAIAAMPGGRVQQLAIDYAINRRFRRDVFARDATRLDDADAGRQLESMAVGYIEESDLTETVRVPRGELRLQADFIADARRLFSAGPLPLGAAAASLAGGRRETGEILRNLTYLVAAGALQPCATVPRARREASRHRPHALLERTLELIRADQVARPVPSPVLGNGVTIDVARASALSEWLAAPPGRRLPAALDPLLKTLDRLGLMT